MSASVGQNLDTTPVEHRAIDNRVDESGMEVSFSLDVHGCMGQEVPVQLYSMDASDKQTFMADKILKPGYEDATWAKVDLFVPLSRFAGINPATKWVIYVQNPKDTSEYIEKASFTLNEPYRPGLIWSWKQWTDEVISTDGENGFQIKARLDANGYAGQQFESVVILEDADGNAIKSKDGTPMTVSGQHLNCIYDSSYWESLQFNIPYSDLTHFWAGQLIYARPGIRFQDGSLTGGNVYFKFWAGGSLNTVYDKYTSESTKLDTEINRLNDQLNALGGVGP
jgi:hypothetical protein